MAEFKVGDKVSWMGLNGIVKGFNPKLIHSVLVVFKNKESECFLPDGRADPRHLKPSLKHRRFKKSGKVREIWVNIYEADVQSYLRKSRAESSKDDWVVERAVRFVRAKCQGPK